jgi:perosamine synthetase
VLNQQVPLFGEIKNITTAEGGMITTNDPEIARLVRLVRHEGEMWLSTNASVINSHPSSLRDMIYGIGYPVVGNNYRMNALQAALGVVQLKKLDVLNRKRIETANYYIQGLTEFPFFVLPKTDQYSSHVYNRFVLRLKSDSLGLSRDGFLAALISEGIPVGVYYPVPLNKHLIISSKGFRSAELVYPGAELVCRTQIVLPSYPKIGQQERDDVLKAIQKIVETVSEKPHIIAEIEDVASRMKANYFGQFFSCM